MGHSDLDLFAWAQQNAHRHQETTQTPKQPLTVSQINGQAKRLLEAQYTRVAVVGEVSSYKQGPSGHCYFSLKDNDAVLPVALFRREAQRVRFDLKNGKQVVVTGKLTIYGRSGRYQMIAEDIQPLGKGALQEAFEALKNKLQGEGLFDQDPKQPLPLLPKRVAVITSPTGAVIRDIIQVATRRFPNAHMVLIPTRVQGESAAMQIVSAIERANDDGCFDVIILARGGGSLEDLWPFNTEPVARAIALSTVPIVSAVGHETDFTIADFVADHRAPTPSAAAELVFPVGSVLFEQLHHQLTRCTQGMRRRTQHHRLELMALVRNFEDGRAMTRDASQRMADLHMRLHHGLRHVITTHTQRLVHNRTRLAAGHPQLRLKTMEGQCQEYQWRIMRAVKLQLSRRRQALRALGQRLDALSPLRVLERGYAVVLDAKGGAMRHASKAAPGDRLDIRLARGTIKATVDATAGPC